MTDDCGDTPDQTDVPDSREDYVVPALTELGSFQELTQNGVGAVVDAEGMS